jgi:hypothetical protein
MTGNTGGAASNSFQTENGTVRSKFGLGGGGAKPGVMFFF